MALNPEPPPSVPQRQKIFILYGIPRISTFHDDPFPNFFVTCGYITVVREGSRVTMAALNYIKFNTVLKIEIDSFVL